MSHPNEGESLNQNRASARKYLHWAIQRIRSKWQEVFSDSSENSTVTLLCDFVAGTSFHHGMTVGRLRENAGRYWSGICPQ